MRRLVPVLLLAILALPAAVRAQWIYDGTRFNSRSIVGTRAAVSDGSGGIIVISTDAVGLYTDIYAQRIDAQGVARWATDGVAVCTAADTQDFATAIADGSGGVIVAWYDNRTGGEDIYVQRLNANGVPLWTANGVALCTASGTQIYPDIVSDGAGGAFVTWWDGRSGTNWDVYVRRINSTGVAQWAADGVAASALLSTENNPHLASDGAGGTIVGWLDTRSGNADVYAQRFNAAGVAQWTANGLPVCADGSDQSSPQIATDGSGGAYLAWSDFRAGNYDIFMQRINSAGAPQWQVDGIGVCTSSGYQQFPRIINDGAGGAIAAWQDYRNTLDSDLYTQRVTPGGIALWEYDGVALSKANGSQTSPVLVSDGAQGVVAAWQDDRYFNFVMEIFARRVNASGLAMWDIDGSPLCTATGGQSGVVAAGDGAGGAIVAWTDARGSANLVYAQRVEPRYGYWGRPEPTIKSARDNPSDQGGKVIVRWAASQRDLSYMPGISHYSVWRATDVVAAGALQSSGAGAVVTDPREVTREFSGKAIWTQALAAGPAYWEWVGNVEASYQSTYSATAPTRQDSTVAGPATAYFKVLAHENQYPQARMWESASVSARSVDNLAPAAPLLLTIRQSGSNAVLAWKPVDDADLDNYTLYRAGASGVQVIPVNKLSDATLPNYTDIGAGAGGYYYVVTAKDIHGNRSAPSNEVSLSGATGIGDAPPLTALSLQPNFPNPFSTRTDLSIGAPVAGAASIELFDIAGRLVLSRPLGAMRAGWQRVAFDAVDNGGAPLASGVYLCRVRMNGQEVTSKMVIAR